MPSALISQISKVVLHPHLVWLPRAYNALPSHLFGSAPFQKRRRGGSLHRGSELRSEGETTFLPLLTAPGIDKVVLPSRQCGSCGINNVLLCGSAEGCVCLVTAETLLRILIYFKLRRVFTKLIRYFLKYFYFEDLSNHRSRVDLYLAHKLFFRSLLMKHDWIRRGGCGLQRSCLVESYLAGQHFSVP